MLMKILRWLLIAVVIFAVYKIVGGDIASAMSSVLDFLFSIIDRASDWAVSIWYSV